MKKPLLSSAICLTLGLTACQNVENQIDANGDKSPKQSRSYGYDPLAYRFYEGYIEGVNYSGMIDGVAGSYMSDVIFAHKSPDANTTFFSLGYTPTFSSNSPTYSNLPVYMKYSTYDEHLIIIDQTRGLDVYKVERVNDVSVEFGNVLAYTYLPNALNYTSSMPTPCHAEFSPYTSDGIYLAIASNSSPGIYIYKKSTTVPDSYSLLSVNNTGINLSGGAKASSFSKDGKYLAILTTSNNVVIYKRNGNTFSQVQAASSVELSNVADLDFAPEGNYLALVYGSTANYVNVYNIEDNDSIRLVDQLATTNSPTQVQYAPAWPYSPDDEWSCRNCTCPDYGEDYCACLDGAFSNNLECCQSHVDPDPAPFESRLHTCGSGFIEYFHILGEVYNKEPLVVMHADQQPNNVKKIILPLHRSIPNYYESNTENLFTIDNSVNGSQLLRFFQGGCWY